MLTEFTKLKITLSHDGVGIYIAFCVGLAAIDVVIGLISLGVSHDSIITNTKLIKIVHIFLCLIFLTALILCSLYFGNKSYNNYQNYRQATNYILE